MWLRQGTSITVRIGPFVNISDGLANTGLSISQSDIRLSKNGGDYAQSNDTGGGSHDENGWYIITLDATDTGTLGRLKVAIDMSSVIPVWESYMIVPQQVWDSLFGSDKLQVHADEITAGLITATALATDAGNKLADQIIRRSFQNACDSSDGDTKSFRSMLGLIATFVNKIAPNGTDLEVYEDDDVTVLGSRAMTTSGAAEAITALDTN